MVRRQQAYEILSHNDQYLVSHDLSRIVRMGQEWIKDLDRARTAYEIERTHIGDKQNVITKYFHTKGKTNGNGYREMEGGYQHGG